MKKRINFIFILSILIGCGKTAFDVGSSTNSNSAPGSYQLPPKVDFLLVEQDTGSIAPVLSSIASQVNLFLNQFDQKKWDYHFATMALSHPPTSRYPLTQVIGSVYDYNRASPQWGSSWVPLYPGQAPDFATMLSPSVFKIPSQYTGFVTQISQLTDAMNGFQPGFQNILSALQTGLGNSKFLRSDSYFVVLFVGNQDDTSLVNFCSLGPGSTGACSGSDCAISSQNLTGYGGDCNSQKTSFNWYRSQFAQLNMHFYSAVAHSNQSNCLGGKAIAGNRYIQMSYALGGQSYDLCSQSIASILSSLATSLQSERINFITKYLFMSQAPDPSSIQIQKFVGGDPNRPISIPQDPNDGWTYVGFTTHYAISSPSPMGQTTGYAIELNGTAQLTGLDTASITYYPSVNQSTISH